MIQKFAFVVGQITVLVGNGNLQKLNGSAADNRDKCTTKPVSFTVASFQSICEAGWPWSWLASIQTTVKEPKLS